MLSGIVTVSTQAVHHPVPADNVIRILSVLVSASVAGVLGDVSLAAPIPGEGLDRIADHAGCRLFSADDPGVALDAAAQAARHDTILVISVAGLPPTGFHQELDGLLRAGVRHCLMRTEAAGFLQRLFPGLCPVAMVMAPRMAVRRAAPAFARGGMRALVRALGPARMLQARAMVQAGLS